MKQQPIVKAAQIELVQTNRFARIFPASPLSRGIFAGVLSQESTSPSREEVSFLVESKQTCGTETGCAIIESNSQSPKASHR
jgi:hypothetical protein